MQLISDPQDVDLLDNWQRDFPLCDQPYAHIGKQIGLPEAEVLTRLQNMKKAGRVTRVGATFAPNTVSASTLAAVAAPPERIEEVAAIIGAQDGVNHSYMRENHWNLWFVATGPDRDHVDRALADIGAQTGLEVMDLRLVRPFNLDLGFSMKRSANRAIPKRASVRPADPSAMQPGDRAILQALSTGLPITSRPYADLADRLGRDAETVIARITALQEAGIISRFGVIVRHRALGWSANAMVVWDLPSDRIDSAGPALAAIPGVTLCYERRNVPGIWPYRLYNMIHARSRAEAKSVLEAAQALPELRNAPHEVLFSTRCFKQTGAMIAGKREAAA